MHGFHLTALTAYTAGLLLMSTAQRLYALAGPRGDVIGGGSRSRARAIGSFVTPSLPRGCSPVLCVCAHASRRVERATRPQAGWRRADSGARPRSVGRSHPSEAPKLGVLRRRISSRRRFSLIFPCHQPARRPVFMELLGCQHESSYCQQAVARRPRRYELATRPHVRHLCLSGR